MAERSPRNRIAVVSRCPSCDELLGRGYLGCDNCVERVELPLFADWRALLAAESVTAGSVAERELAESVVSERPGRRPWPCVDKALSLLPCPDCRGTLGSGDQDCARCAAADAHRWLWPTPDPLAAALRSATVVLRAPQRTRTAVADTWRLCLPFVLLGDAPSPHQRRRITTAVLAGRSVELTAATSLIDLASLPSLPWRTASSAPVPAH